MPYSVRNLKKRVFLDCSGLESVILPANISEVDAGCFQNCVNLKSVVLPESSVKMSVRDYVFDGCRSLESLDMPERIIFIGNGSFRGCTGLKSMTVPSYAGSIGDSAFLGCSSMKKVVIGQSVKSIGDSAFAGCRALDSVICHAQEPGTFVRNAFDGIGERCVLKVPYGRSEAYRDAGWTEEVFRGGIVEMSAPEGIRGVRVSRQDGRCYDLEGRPVDKPVKGRIYIKDGRKMIEK
jgi:hypothetical protein